MVCGLNLMDYKTFRAFCFCNISVNVSVFTTWDYPTCTLLSLFQIQLPINCFHFIISIQAVAGFLLQSQSLLCWSFENKIDCRYNLQPWTCNQLSMPQLCSLVICHSSLTIEHRTTEQRAQGSAWDIEPIINRFQFASRFNIQSFLFQLRNLENHPVHPQMNLTMM